MAFKATKDYGNPLLDAGTPTIYLRVGTSPLVKVVAVGDPGNTIDPVAAPDGSIVTAIGIERDGFRGGNLAIAASMLNIETTASMAGIYMTRIP